VPYHVEEGEGAPDGVVVVGEGDGAEAILVVAMHLVLFVLDGLAAAGGGAEGDGAGDEDDELAGGGALEVAEVADVGGVGQHDGLLLPTSGGGGIAGGFEHQQRRDLHGGIRPGGEGDRDGLGVGIGIGIGIGCRRRAVAFGELRIGKGTPTR